MLLLRMGFHACDILVEPTVQVHYVGFTLNPDCFQCCSLPEARCCPLDLCSLLVNAVVGGVGVHSYSILLVVISYSLFVLGHSNLQSSLGLANVYLVAVLEGTCACGLCPLCLHKYNSVYITPKGVKFLCCHGCACDVM